MRWGVVGHGRIVPTFLDAARGVGHEVVAVVGRDPSRVAAFAAGHGISRNDTDPSNLVGEVDSVYVATPHSGHRDAALALLPAGVPVLCEKPMAANATQVRQMLDAARGSGAFLMEAMWTRHLPVLRRLREWIDQGRKSEQSRRPSGSAPRISRPAGSGLPSWPEAACSTSASTH